jgi:hypothetical protein
MGWARAGATGNRSFISTCAHIALVPSGAHHCCRLQGRFPRYFDSLKGRPFGVANWFQTLQFPNSYAKGIDARQLRDLVRILTARRPYWSTRHWRKHSWNITWRTVR